MKKCSGYILIFFIPVFFWSLFAFAQKQVTISGYLADAESGEALIYANVYIVGTKKGTVTNEYGFYSISITADTIVISFNYLGYTSQTRKLTGNKDQTLNVKLHSASSKLQEVTIVADKDQQQEDLNSTRMSVIKVPVKQLKTIPSLGGETDIIKVMQLMPGVAKGGEGGSGMFVRGGDVDQNLVMLDEATVYNIGHLFGFFSVFNPDAINDMTMIKGAFPAYYGGRLSSVLDIRMKEGNMYKFHGEGGIGLLSSRFSIEGPIIKEKMSYLVSGRRTYIDQVFKLLGANIPYYFYDLNAKVNYRISDNDRLFFSSYFGDDVLKLNEEMIEEQENADSASSEEDSTQYLGDLDFGFTLGNFSQTLRWNHLYSPKLFSNFSLIHTTFNYDIWGHFLDNSILINSNIRDIGVKMDFNYYRSASTTYRYGLNITNHIFRPNVVSTSGEITEALAAGEGDRQITQEIALYGDCEFDIYEDLVRGQAGFRMSSSVVRNKVYLGPEPRLSMRYSLSDQDAIKVSYSKMLQYMHRVSSSSIALPTDLWYPVSENVKPQLADQLASGYNHLFKKIKTSVSIETYYKWMYNLIEYREGTNLILNDNFESQLLQGRGRSYGFEALFKKDRGRFSGWLGYTLSWSTRDFSELNDGKTFWAKYDRRHNLSLVINYSLGIKWDMSIVWEYATGARFTAIVGQYFVPNATLTGVDIIPVYTDKNAVRMSPSHRLDINFVKKPKKERKFYSEWHFGCYNFYNRATPYRINVVPTGDGGYRYEQPGLFGRILSIAYNFKF